MLNYGATRTLLKDADTITSQHQVIAEWNMNKYYDIQKYGIYKDPTLATNESTYNANSSNIVTGDAYIIYDDGSKKLSPEREYYSNIASIFKPNRPDPGIVLLQYSANGLIVDQAKEIDVKNITPAAPRFYPFSESRQYDYFNSAKVMDTGLGGKGTKDSNGNISCANPFIVYETQIPCNKLTIKVQNYATVPDNFKIQILLGTTWTTILNATGGGTTYFSDGICELYFNGTSWTTAVTRVTSIDEISNPTPTQFKNIKGVRMIVTKMTADKAQYSNGLEVIEISPRLEVDMTEYVESFSVNSSLGDQSSIGLPVGSLVSGGGDVSLSNENNNFLISSTLSSLKMLNSDVKFSFYQTINGVTFPLQVMYSNKWNVAEDYTITVQLEDGVKYLREIAAPDLFLQGTGIGNRLSYIILTLLDNAGISGFNFVQSSSTPERTEDVVIRNFFCKKEQTIAEVLDSLAVATQCSIFYDANGVLNVLTKERLVEKTTMVESTSTPAALRGTDFWMVFDEDFSTTDAEELSAVEDYHANVISFIEDKINPITDGDIAYHSYGPRKVPGITNLPSKILSRLTEDIPSAALAFANYSYATKILWTTAEDNTSVLGAANLNVDLRYDEPLKDVFDGLTFTALNEEEAIREIYEATNVSASFSGKPYAAIQAKKNLVIFLDRNEGYTIPDYDGIVLIDKEYIKYRGKLFSVNGQLKILFSQEEFNETLRFLPKGSSMSLIGLIVDVKLNIIDRDGAEYVYEVKGDGRGQFNSDEEPHYALAENSDGINPNKTFKLTLGNTKNNPAPGNIKATTKFNFINKNNYKSARDKLGSLNFNDLQAYLGFLKLEGPKSPAEDLANIEKLDSNEVDAAKAFQETNRQVDADVDGDFDPYIYMLGEKNIYGQYVDLDFTPNFISTRMRLFSAVKKRKNDSYISATNSSIAGIGYGVNSNNEGYFVEVESIGAGKDSVAAKATRRNLRFYKVFINSKGKYEVKLLIDAPVKAQTVSNIDVQVIKNSNTADPVFELDIVIKKWDNALEFFIYYGNHEVGSYIEPNKEAVKVEEKRLFMFVRNDSQAVYEWVSAAAKPNTAPIKGYFKSKNALDQAIQSGIIPVDRDFMFKDDKIKYYFNDFARLARQVREYEIRFDAPAFSSALIDISRINPQYMIKKYVPTAFGARLVVVNTSSGPIALGEESDLPLYIVGVGLEELSTGNINMKDYFEDLESRRLKVTEREKNISVYGSQTFALDSQYIQTISQSKNLMKWIIKYCGRQRMKMSIETYPNPLLELGDKIRIYDKGRGYTRSQNNFGDRVFVVSSISHSVSSGGPSTNIEIMEVGA